MLTTGECTRYKRQLMISGIGEAGQEKLKNAKAFVAGAGGLGSPASLYLTAAGVGSIRIVDHDRVELSNLNRQILHGDQDIGRRKVNSAMDRLRALNPGVNIDITGERITRENVHDLVADSDLIVDAMDNFPTRYLLNRAAVDKGIPLFHGAVNGFEGRATTILPGETACLRCMYRGPLPEGTFPVIGVTPAVIGSIQATEAIKYILGMGQLLANRMLIYDGLNMDFTEFKIHRNPDCEHCAQLTKEE